MILCSFECILWFRSLLFIQQSLDKFLQIVEIPLRLVILEKPKNKIKIIILMVIDQEEENWEGKE